MGFPTCEILIQYGADGKSFLLESNSKHIGVELADIPLRYLRSDVNDSDCAIPFAASILAVGSNFSNSCVVNAVAILFNRYHNLLEVGFHYFSKIIA